MKNRELFIPPEGPPQEGRPDSEIYEKMGKENIYKMVADFYRELEKSSIRSLFPKEMAHASEKSADFFVFLLGGPPLYQEKYGHPKMRQRHLPFQIDEAARQVWLGCFDVVLTQAEEKYGFPQKHLAGFRLFLDRFSKWMVNTQTAEKKD